MTTKTPRKTTRVTTSRSRVKVVKDLPVEAPPGVVRTVHDFTEPPALPPYNMDYQPVDPGPLYTPIDRPGVAVRLAIIILAIVALLTLAVVY